MSMPMPERPASGLDQLERADAQAASALRINSEAIAILQSGPESTGSAFLGMALLESRSALQELRLALATVKALWAEGEKAGRAKERAEIEAEQERRRARMRLARRTGAAR